MSKIGPQLPPHLQKSRETPEDPEERVSKSVTTIGPSMPPDIQNSESRIGPIGPSIPPEFLEILRNSVVDENFLPEEDTEESEDTVSSSYGPELPPDLISASNSCEDVDENAEDVGPLPECPAENSEENYEDRLLRFRYEKAIEESATKNKREEWMTELPDGMRQYGLQARSFKQRYESEKSREDSRAAWTDQPGAATSKSSTTNDIPAKAMKERDRKLEEQTEKFNKSRKESLFDEHARKRKAEEEANASMSKERRPFNREEDLKTIQLGKLNREELAEKAKVLGSRFGHGKDARFL